MRTGTVAIPSGGCSPPVRCRACSGYGSIHPPYENEVKTKTLHDKDFDAQSSAGYPDPVYLGVGLDTVAVIERGWTRAAPRMTRETGT